MSWRFEFRFNLCTVQNQNMDATTVVFLPPNLHIHRVHVRNESSVWDLNFHFQDIFLSLTVLPETDLAAVRETKELPTPYRLLVRFRSLPRNP